MMVEQLDIFNEK